MANKSLDDIYDVLSKILDQLQYVDAKTIDPAMRNVERTKEKLKQTKDKWDGK